MNGGLLDLNGLAERVKLYGVPRGADAQFLVAAARQVRGLVVHFVRDDARLAELSEWLAWFAPELEVIEFPAWDCLPYDRISPRSELVVERLAALRRLKSLASGTAAVLLTTVAAALQRVVPPELLP
ncbi:MAG: hypothetical protein ORO03_11255, partial [Alphaproteobacteria bacterium]|nr:hypothetical protein [Alphaproteobacteria bacterium]